MIRPQVLQNSNSCFPRLLKGPMSIECLWILSVFLSMADLTPCCPDMTLSGTMFFRSPSLPVISFIRIFGDVFGLVGEPRGHYRQFVGPHGTACCGVAKKCKGDGRHGGCRHRGSSNYCVDPAFIQMDAHTFVCSVINRYIGPMHPYNNAADLRFVVFYSY